MILLIHIIGAIIFGIWVSHQPDDPQNPMAGTPDYQATTLFIIAIWEFTLLVFFIWWLQAKFGKPQE